METMPAANILIVDDEPVNIMLVERVLSTIHHTHTASNGYEALEMLQTHSFDLVLLDIMMPGISGLDVLRVIRDIYSPQEMPVILVSALGDTKDIQQGLEYKANDYITKPFDIDEIRSRIQTQLYVKSLADAQKAAVAELKHTNELKERMLRIASHDLKNPIHNLSMILSLIEPHLRENQESSELLAMGKDSLSAMQGIIQEFLDMEILRGSELAVELNPVDLDFAVAEVVVQYQNVCKAKQIHIEMDYSDTTIMADRKRLTQVLSNLISNAIKYSPPASTVHIFAEVTPAAATLHIINQGSGIPAAEQSKLFQPFGQTSIRPTAGENSTGLGLWIVKQMMDAQGGEVGLVNPAEGGADFWIRLPKVTELEMAIA